VCRAGRFEKRGRTELLGVAKLGARRDEVEKHFKINRERGKRPA
jgi:hypothetical protein